MDEWNTKTPRTELGSVKVNSLLLAQFNTVTFDNMRVENGACEKLLKKFTWHFPEMAEGLEKRHKAEVDRMGEGR